MNGVLRSAASGVHSCPGGSFLYSLSRPLGLSTAFTCFHSNVASGGSLIGIGTLVGMRSPINPMNSLLFSDGMAAEE